MKDKDGKGYQKVLDDQVQLYTSNKFALFPFLFFVSQRADPSPTFFSDSSPTLSSHPSTKAVWAVSVRS